MSAGERSFFKKGDLIVYAVALALIAVFTLIAFLCPKNEGNTFSVYYKEEKIFSASLSEDADYLFYVTKNGGTVVAFSDNYPDAEYNLLRVRNGAVCVYESSCSDGTCIYMGAKTWGEILCLPHDLRIVVEGEGLETDV